MAQPKLRVKREDGTNYPDWDKKKIGDLAKIFSAARVHRDEWQTEGVPFWRSSDVMAFHQHKVNPMGKAYITLELYEKLSSKSGKMQKGDILITGGGSIGVPYLIQDDCPLYVKDADLLCIQKSVNHNSGFLYQFFWTPTFRSYLGLISHKGTIAHYTITQISETPVAIPCLEEQQKIADFFSIVDKVIAQSEAEVQNLEQQKKAAMQKIFSQEARFRREDGTEFPEWEESTLGRECDFINGKAHENCETENGRYIIVNSKFISTNGEVKRKTNTILERLYIDDIVMVMSDVPNGKAISKCLVIKENNKYTLNQRICALRTKHNSIYISNQISRCKYFMLFDDGVKQTNLRKQDVLDCPISIPCLEEQQKIADFLSAYDEAISYAKQELDKWKELKKGLLQQMFV